MDTIKVIHDAVGQTLTVWWDDPRRPSSGDPRLAVEPVIHTNT